MFDPPLIKKRRINPCPHFSTLKKVLVMKKPVVKALIAAGAMAVVIIILPKLVNRCWEILKEKKHNDLLKFQTP